MNTDEKEAFKEYLQIKGYSSSTRDTICRQAVNFGEWLETENTSTEQATYNDVTAYVSHLKKRGNNQRTVQALITNIRHYYDYLEGLNIVAENPCIAVIVKGIKRRKLHETFSSEELESMYKIFSATLPKSGGIGRKLTHRRNKVILGLIIYQGLRTQELSKLQVSDVKMREGRIFISRGLQSEEREMILEAHQLYDLMDYINETRKALILLTEAETEQLFLSLGTGICFQNIMDRILQSLQQQNPRVKAINQLRASVISNWLKVHNMRKVQKLAGHRYVSSTEAYKVNNMDDLKEDVSRYHPDL